MSTDDDHPYDVPAEVRDRALQKVRKMDKVERVLWVLVALVVAMSVLMSVVSITFDVIQKNNNDAANCRSRLNATAVARALRALNDPPNSDARSAEVALGLAATRSILDGQCNS